jgi:hypothetical protein
MTDPHSTTFRAALYARVSTEDRQVPEDSIALAAQRRSRPPRDIRRSHRGGVLGRRRLPVLAVVSAP